MKSEMKPKAFTLRDHVKITIPYNKGTSTKSYP